MENLLPERYRLDFLIIRETAERIIHDFYSFGFSITFSGNEQNAYEELSTQLVTLLNELISKDRQKLMRILYKVDIGEQKLEKMRLKYPGAGLSEIIAHLVIEREMQKVITRKYFK